MLATVRSAAGSRGKMSLGVPCAPSARVAVPPWTALLDGAELVGDEAEVDLAADLELVVDPHAASTRAKAPARTTILGVVSFLPPEDCPMAVPPGCWWRAEL